MRLDRRARRVTPLGTFNRSMHRVLGGFYGAGVLLWARYPCTGHRHNYARLRPEGASRDGVRIGRERAKAKVVIEG